MVSPRRVVLVLVLVILAAGCADAARPALAPRPTATPAPQAQLDPLLAPVLAGEQPVAATDPAALGQQIVVAESAIRDPARPPGQVAAAGRLAQAAYRALGERPDWDAAVLAAVPEQFREPLVRTVAAQRELLDLSGRPGDTLPAWRIVEPLPPNELRELYADAEERFGVPWHVLAAVHLVETGMGRIVGLSTAGAQGPMQFMPATWRAYGMGGDVWNTRDAIMGAANYLRANGGSLGTDEGLNRALYRYNNDLRYVRAVRHYATLMQADERAFLGFHAWSVFFRTSAGDILLPTGYQQPRRIPVQEWLARQPYRPSPR